MDEKALQRLRWRSRRGLLELPDNDLLDLVMGRAEAPDAELRGVVDMLRAA
ncbi:MAG TPA: hypothetical protein VHQ02_00795 [Usitatibacter sp.]|nr:hypothetical protein [Usitatibacter sp.]